jgi:hypothetical protein
MSIIDNVVTVATTPFGAIDPVTLFLIVGLVIVFAASWYMVLYHLRLAGIGE